MRTQVKIKPERRRTLRYTPEVCNIAYNLLKSRGLTMPELAEMLGIGRSTLYLWMQKIPELMEAVARGRAAFDGEKVENALLKKALGFETEEITKERGRVVKRVVKEVAPDVSAQKFWLTNRRPERWKERIDQNTSVGVQILIPDLIRKPVNSGMTSGYGDSTETLILGDEGVKMTIPTASPTQPVKEEE